MSIPTDREIAAAARFALDTRNPARGLHAAHAVGTALVRIVFNGNRWNPATDETWRVTERTRDDFIAVGIDENGNETRDWHVITA